MTGLATGAEHYNRTARLLHRAMASAGKYPLGWLLAGLVVLHGSAALRHHPILKDRVLDRML